jgi:predicted ATPase
MTDPRKIIGRMFREDQRFDNFGNVLTSIQLQGFRCHENTLIDIKSPITALCGINGTGKSTILQLAAAAYKSPDKTVKPSYYLRDFLVVGNLDLEPFTTTAKVEYKFFKSDRTLMTRTISRKDDTKRWRGYPGRPEKWAYFSGVGSYLPKFERPDFIFRNSGRLEIINIDDVSTHIKDSICKVLGQTYDEISKNEVKYYTKKGDVISVSKAGVRYSEAHMGFGEGRIQYLINLLETLPEQSLILIEEPETSLHPSAQHEFALYLNEVVARRKHQILLTTHSEFILQALPSESSIYLKRSGNGISGIPGLTSLEAKSLMADGHTKALNIFVEDKFAKAVLTEILRHSDKDFLGSVGIHPIGGFNLIRQLTEALTPLEYAVAAVLDGDKNGLTGGNIFALPGDNPPEIEIFNNANVREYISSHFDIDLDDFQARLHGIDHHDWFRRLAECISKDESALIWELSRVYAESLPETISDALKDGLKESSR